MHILDIQSQTDELHAIFNKMRQGNAILFLGAGASVGEKRYLSKEVIEYYEDYLGKQLNVSDITRFVDILSADPHFSRTHFDSEVEKMLRKLDLTEGHKIMATVPWLEIITTNYDLLVEKAYDALNGKNPFKLVPIRTLQKYNYRSSNDEIKYVKLNGCVSDKSEFPLIFSSDDFQQSKSFYKNVLHDLKNISPNISFISIGYSFQDELGKQLLEKFDSYNFRERKWMINIDPYPNENALAYYTQQRIQIIKASFKDFFAAYAAWNDKGMEYVVNKRKLRFTDSREIRIQIPNTLAVQLNGVIRQLNSQVDSKPINPQDYYKGEEPNYHVILKGLDVIRSIQSKRIKAIIQKAVENNNSPFVPIFFLKGDFGIGKSTIGLRLIHELNQIEDLNLVAFEIVDFLKLRSEHLRSLFEHCSAKNIVLFCDEIEIDSAFKSLLDLRRELSIDQFTEFNLFFVAPIRENILERHKTIRDVKEAHEININGRLSKSEITDLLEKLKLSKLVNFRDEQEKQRLISKVHNEFKGDSFIALLELVTGGKHINELIGAYNELSLDAQSAFKYTALLHRYKLSMPASWLKHIISLDWDIFTEKVIKAEGRGILIQDSKTHFGTEPDLYFHTKHPIIAERLIQQLLPSKEKQYKSYVRMLNTVDFGATNSHLVINLLKAFRSNDVFSSTKINKLYDIAHTKLSDDPYYLLNYAINLQYRNNQTDLKKGLDLLIYAESLLEYQNHRFIHRRAVMNFELARLYYKKETKLNFTTTFLEEAKDLFITKQLHDPFSAYSYVDYLKLLIWEINKINYEDEFQLQLNIQIQELFDLASNAVTENLDRLESLRTEYANYLKEISDDSEYLNYLETLYSQANLRPYACILLFNYYESTENSEEKKSFLVDEMKHHMDNNEVVKFLFKYSARRLHDNNERIYFFELSKKFSFLEEVLPLRFHYYNFVAESYNRHFKYGLEHLKQIKTRYNGLNPEFHVVWQDPFGEDWVFEGIVVARGNNSHKGMKIPYLQRTFRLIKGNYEKYSPGHKANVKLHFYLDGLRAEIVETPDDTLM